MPSLAVDMSPAPRLPEKLAAFQRFGRGGTKKLILPMPDIGNDLSVDAGRLGDLGTALDIAPSGAPMAAEAPSRLWAGLGERVNRTASAAAPEGSQRDQGGKWLGTSLIS
jgi:hypothetical protein